MEEKTFYNDNINPAAHYIIRETIIPFIKNTSSNPRFLEFGCSTGALGAKVLEEIPNAEWTGIDYNKKALEIARHRITKAYNADLNKLTPTWIKDISVSPDFIVMIDVLEHVYEPSMLLNLISEVFPSSKIICILPNVACYQTYDRISSHEFDYDLHGIFDKTHKTFFTAKSAINFFKDKGYMPEYGPIFLPDPVMRDVISTNHDYPYTFTREKYSVEINDKNELLSICSYGFGILFNPTK